MPPKHQLLVLLVLVFCDRNVLGARILGVFPPPAPSHYILGSRLMKELAARGHQITMISFFGEKKPVENYKDVLLTKNVSENAVSEKMKDLLDMPNKPFYYQFLHMYHLGRKITTDTLNHPNFKELLDSNQTFDLIIMESFFNEALVFLAHHYNTPLIILSTFGSTTWLNNFVKNPEPSSYLPTLLFEYSDRMSFFQRMKNFLMTNIIEGLYLFYVLPDQNRILKSFYPNVPDINNIIKQRTTLILLNSHPSFGIAKPMVPNMIEIGGYHIEEPRALPKDLQDYLDGARNGFILFTMGSNLKSSMLPEKIKKDILTVFAQLPYRVLWKFEEDLPEKPNNVKISKWLPQNDILAHPNLRLFITHSGLLSTTEAVYHGVPILGIPVFADQRMNMAQSQKLGIGKTLPFNKLNVDTFYNSIQEIIQNKTYRENVRLRSKLLRDQPMRPIDKAMFWIEYVLRNGYCPHLRIGGMNMDWYQIRQIDVIAVLTLLGVLLFVIVKTILRKICCCRKPNMVNVVNEKKEL